ncbi:peroxiredoxin [Adhaeribacter rhizoryzae]|uniref:thioredoxin-dependent peroxiredoxin n=1 Tax=Adhaeribacter rhizoryzae TaxID=2607907 RepID=A0A5M6DF83_9BACT|nr:peroxiredoxin [Adhaeribacter rhizoryzae]KAA5544839.1 peroxiredoxin [Adhaeribacter rhizoryzae]
MLKVGDSAPDFSLQTATGEIFRLSEVLRESNVVLYFYPKDDTRGCTAQACSFRDQYEIFRESNAEVVGVSSDDAESHQQFSAKHRLPFTLLSDAKGEVRKLYRVPRTFGIVPGRVTYLIDKAGIVRYAFNSQLKPLEHVSGTLEILKTLA